MTLKEALFALAFFTAISMVFFYKVFLGLIPLPTDLIVGAYHPWLNYKWGNYIVGVPVQNSKLSDAVSIYYPLKSLVADFARKGELPLWNPYMFGGYPLFANVQVGSLFPTMILYLLFTSHIAWTLQVISQPILASFFMFLLLRHFNLSKLPSIFGGIVYGFGGSTILWIQWNTQATTSLFLPILILLGDKYLITKKKKWGVFLSIFICLQIFAGYLPIIPFTYLGMAIWYLFRSKKYFSDLKILFFIILGITLSAVFLLPVAELIKISQRVVETLDENVPFFAIENLINLIAPDFFGNPATGNFWGRGDNMDSTIYAGVTTLIFALLGLKKFFGKAEVKFALCIFVVTLIISISNPISVFLYKIGLWGGPSITLNRANFLLNFSLAILGAYGFSLVKKDLKLTLKPSILILSISLGIMTGLLVCKFFLKEEVELVLTHINTSLRNFILPMLIILTVSLLILLVNKFRLFKPIGYLLFILVLTIELFRFGLKFNTFSSADFIYPQTPISAFLKNYPNDRFIAERDVFPANMWVPLKLSSIQGYDGVYPYSAAKILAVADSEDVDIAPKPRWGLIGNFNSKILDESNTRFLVTVKREDNQDKANRYREIFEDKGVTILENTKSLPRVYLTKKVIKASDREALKLLIDNNFPIEQISISENFEYDNNSPEILDAQLNYTPLTNSHVLVKATSNIDAYLVILDSFYPGWKASIDGKETSIYRTNYNFRGVFLPKGTHNIDLIYSPKSLRVGAAITAISILIVAILLTYKRIFRFL